MINTTDTGLKMLSALADKLGTTTEHIIQVYSKQAQISGALDLICTAASFLGALGLLYFGTMKFRKAVRNGYDDWEILCVSPLIILALFTAVLFFVFLAYTPDNVSKMANPEYWAVHELMGTIFGGQK